MKDQLIEKMTEYVKEKTKTHPLAKIAGANEKHVIEFCAECATAHFADKWVKVSDEMPEHRRKIWFAVKGLKYPIYGYYDKIIGVFKAEFDLEFNGHDKSNIVYAWMYEVTPTPPQE